jgi:hypothetical protein
MVWFLQRGISVLSQESVSTVSVGTPFSAGKTPLLKRLDSFRGPAVTPPMPSTATPPPVAVTPPAVSVGVLAVCVGLCHAPCVIVSDVWPGVARLRYS